MYRRTSRGSGGGGEPIRVGGQERNKVNHVTGKGGSNIGSWDVLNLLWIKFEPSALALKKDLRRFKWGCCIFGDPGAVSRAGEKGRDESFQAQAEKPLDTDSHRTISKRSSERWLLIGQKNALYYCAQSANSIPWVLFVSSYTTAINSITACLAHALKKWTPSGNFQFDINCPFQNTVYPKTKGAFPKRQVWAYNRYSRFHRSRFHRSRLRKY